MSTTTVIEIFPNQKSAEKAYRYALKCGYRPDDITVIMKDNFENSKLIGKEKSKSLEQVGEGGAAGGAIGGLLGIIIALGGNIVAPGIGLIVAGPLAGVVAGTLMGTLLSLGMSESQACGYQEAIDVGKIILCIEAHEHTDLAKKWEEIKKQ